MKIYNCKSIILSSAIIVVVVFFSVANANELNLRGKIIFNTYKGLEVISLDNVESWSNPELIKTENLPIAYPEWLPDGKSVVCEFGNMNKITSIELDNLNVVFWDSPNADMLPDGYLEKFIQPQVSPNGEYLAMYLIDNNTGYRMAVYDKKNNSLKICYEEYSQTKRFSWFQDSNKIAFETRDREVALYDFKNHAITILIKGRYPIIHPISNEIYYVGLDDKLYVISVDDRTPKRISRKNWGWVIPIAFSKDGRFLYYTDTATVFLLEKEAIYVYDIKLNEKHRISCKYSNIEGGSLFEE